LFLLPVVQAQPAKESPKPPAPPPVKAEPLTLEKLFPKDGLFGPTAHGMAFGYDGKYAAYLHRSLSERKNGNDVWLLDMSSGKTTRITTPAIMAKFQASARKADNKTNFTSGVSNFTWSPVAHEMLFTSEGDVYRWKVGDRE